MTAVDGTLGDGGHSTAILERISPDGRLIAVDQDPEAVNRCRSKFSTENRIDFVVENFRNIPEILARLNLKHVDAVILDVGFSSDQLEDSSRGFSFDRDGPLDMRMSPQSPLTACDLIHDLSQGELERIFREYGEERWSRRYAQAICREREISRIETTAQLAGLIQKCTPFRPSPKKKKSGFKRIHPATRVFQALRIAVNDELGALRDALKGVWPLLSRGGKIAVISFHSLEDRIVKWQFREWKAGGEGTILTPKPVTPTEEEVKQNLRSRSAKLRVMEKSL